MQNRLTRSKSPYLRKSASQPIDWWEWSEEAFQKAAQEDKPILLSIGGVWCHWCHVMAHESFQDQEIARIINENFVAIKVDRDERPDIDRVYQDIVFDITGSGGWPLTVFLTSDGRAFYGGTYFPPEDRWGRPGFKSVLLRISQLWKEDREKLFKSASYLFEELQSLSKAGFKDMLEESLLMLGINSTLSSVDYQLGGIGSAPKFHHSKALELLLCHYYFTKDGLTRRALEVSLDAMAKGGVYDHLLGGFFRYSTDDTWSIPHFEKMLYDNAELLRLYSLAFAVFGKPLYEYVSKGIVRYYREYGHNQEGGFYASQDADIGLLDEGGYYIFSFATLESILNQEEFDAIKGYFGFKSMPTDPDKKVLTIEKDLEEGIKALLESAKKKMLQHRESREIPYIDQTLYTSWNGLMMDGLCNYWKVFGDDWAVDISLKTADRLWAERYKDGLIEHSEGVKGYCEDYMFFAQGLLSLYEITQNERYFEKAKTLLDRAIELFWDGQNWGFFETSEDGPGLLRIRRKSIMDTPIQSANGIAPYLLLLLHALTGDERYLDLAKKSLMAFTKLVRESPMTSHSYLMSLYAFFKGILKVETGKHFYDALRVFRPFKFIVKRDIEGIVVCEKNTCKIFDSLDQMYM
ncbi:MAG: thioredoxin domain-containing protein [Aquificaceae bacterium]